MKIPTDYNDYRANKLRKEMVMTVREYNALLESISLLSPQEKVDLLAEIANQLRADNRKGQKRSIMELEGLGKEIWAGIDAQEYVDRERDSWNG